MRHRKSGRKLNRNASHRLALMRNLTLALLEHGRIITTVAKAKEARGFVERLITLAKKGTLHARRLALARLPHREAVAVLFDDLAPRYQDRPGGYTRVIKRHERRLGDAGETAFLELLKAGEVKFQKTAAAPAPRVTPVVPAPIVPPVAEAPTTAPATETPAAPTETVPETTAATTTAPAATEPPVPPAAG